jgi:YVTN family beta-propeller protein
MNIFPSKTLAAVFLASWFSLSCPAADTSSKPQWLSPSTLRASPDGATLFIGCTTGERVLFFDVTARRVKESVQLPLPPTGLAVSADGRSLYVTCAGPQSQVCIVDVLKARLAAKLNAGHTAYAPVLSPDGKTLYVCNRFENSVSVFDLANKKEIRKIAVQREPVAAAITPDGKRLLVANHLHTGRADADYVAAVVSVIDTDAGSVVKELRLPNGSGLLNDLAISPDGKYAVVSHILARYPLPTTQLDRGWMNTNAKTLIALDRMEVLNTVLLDNVDRGAANAWGTGWSADGQKLVVALAGTHEVSVTDFPALLQKLAKLSEGPPADYSAASRVPADVPNDLSFLVGVRERRRLPEGDLGPRGVVVVGRVAYTANYFSDTLTALELDGPHPRAESLALGPKPEMTASRQGELYFNDARICFQGWQSCASCHPGDARADGLNWDLLNDGIGNPKNNKSLLLAFKTPPAMSIGVRESAEAAVEAGIRHILFTVQPPEVAESLGAYIRSLSPVPSPHLVKGKLSAKAQRGEKLFRSKEVGCAQCHPSPLFTDLQSYDVGTRGRFDREVGTFDTPTLVELWRTAPYLHDGAAATIRDILTTANKKNEHGKTSQLTPEQIDTLVEYLLSL